jgi:hypothetical protein
MGIKEQLTKLKENWLLIVLVLVLLVFVSGGNNIQQSFSGVSSKMLSGDMMVESASYRGGYYPPSDFAPEVEERQIIKTTSMSSEIERGEFSEAELMLKGIIQASDSFILSENVNQNGKGLSAYMRGYYSIKVEVGKYDSVVAQLKELGEVKSFSENSQDVTGRYTDLKIQIESEESKLVRYQQMYSEAEEVGDKLTLNDRMFDQERRIKSLKQSLESIDTKVEYSTISLTMTEEQSGYANTALVNFSELIKGLVGSFNGLLKLVFVLAPWAIALWIILFVKKLIKKKK